MKPQDEIKVAQLLEQNAAIIDEQRAKIAELERANLVLTSEKTARALVAEMDQKGMIQGEDSDKEAMVDSLAKLARENPSAFQARVEGVKLAGMPLGSWGIGSPNGAAPSTKPGETEFDRWVMS